MAALEAAEVAPSARARMAGLVCGREAVPTPLGSDCVLPGINPQGWEGQHVGGCPDQGLGREFAFPAPWRELAPTLSEALEKRLYRVTFAASHYLE